ncbi:MAG: KEOPS complex subunit Pcc1 [Desulfurococcaceae archaeon]
MEVSLRLRARGDAREVIALYRSVRPDNVATPYLEIRDSLRQEGTGALMEVELKASGIRGIRSVRNAANELLMLMGLILSARGEALRGPAEPR